MAKLSIFALAGALLISMLPAIGQAADLPEPPVIEPIPAVGGWYLRGDVGYKVYKDPKVSYAGNKYKNEKLDDTGVIGGGVGYKVSEYFRVDGTVDYEFKTPFHGKLICPQLGCGPQPGGPYYSKEKAKVSAITPLLNAYIDLPFFGDHITPYVGAGVGASYIMVDDYKYTNPNGATGKQRGDNDWSFSWALMAGVGFQVADNVVIDAGYRYLNIGDGKTKKAAGFAGATPIKFKDIQAHEFRVGVRYLLD